MKSRLQVNAGVITIEMIKSMDEQRNQECTLEVMNVDTWERRQLEKFSQVIEAPNWTHDGKALIYNSKGHIYRYELDTKIDREILTEPVVNCNNDHVLSADGTSLAVSSFDCDNGCVSRVYTLPIGGGIPKLVTEQGPSYLHGWSPDGEELAFCGKRGGGEYNIYTIAADGSEETARTAGPWLDDGPEYSPCGKYIWFNSNRSGLMQLWRMCRDGSALVQVTKLDRNCWFPHISPNGKKVVFITYRVGDLLPNEHLPDKAVEIWIMDADGTNPKILVSFQGGQGSINVNSWSPDSKKIAFVTY